jgi:FKBP-type peptidyl-prolyl cis-trans isomerase 2
MKEGDFLKVEFTGRVADTGEIFDLTSEELAKKEGIHRPNYRYGPVLVIVGAGMIVPGVERELKGMKPGEEKGFDVRPEEAFGRRDIKNIKIVSLANFIRQKISPVPGIFVTINGRQARIQSVSGGRVRVDFNHPLAGKKLRYKVRIDSVIDGPFDRALSIRDYYGLDCEMELKEGVLEVRAREPLKNIVKKLLEDTVTKWIREIKKVSFPDEPGKKVKSRAGEETDARKE